MEGNLMGMVGAFIAVAILLGVGTVILGNSTMDCSQLPGYTVGPGSTLTTNSTGWAATCLDSNEQTQSAYALLLIVLIVIAAVVILTVVRML